MTSSLLPKSRSGARRLTIELFVVAALAGGPATFPRDASASAAWSFVVHHWSVLAHVVLGVLVLGEAAHLLVRGGELSGRRHSVLAGLALAGSLAAVAAGTMYVSSGQAEGWLTAMTTGWLVAILAAGAEWWTCARAIRADTTRP